MLKKSDCPFLSLFLICFFALLSNACKEKSEQQETDPTGHHSLKSTFTDAFYIGAALNKKTLEGTDSLGLAIVLKEFNAISPENEMKWMHIHPKKDSFHFAVADTYVALGKKHNMHTLGHTLVWHSQTAEYLKEIRDSATMASHLENHITTIVGRYRGKVDAWDVVNEALNEDGTLRETIFLEVLGESYIENAFTWVALADPEAEMIYNDYNLWKPEKRDGVVRLVRRLQAKNIKIDGVGMQGHWNLNEPSLEDIENSILAYNNLGLKVSITELDITVLPNPWDLEGAEISQNFEGSAFMNPYPDQLPDSVQVQLARRYKEIFQLFLKHRDKIKRVTFWGVHDGGSWLNGWPIKGRSNYPLLFDRDYLPKQAYDSIVSLTN